jgi:hypothetical protein
VAGTWDPPRLAAAVCETVWWVTLVDATLVRYHPRDYESALAGKSVRSREIEESIEGLRYVRNQLGRSVDPAEFVHPARDDGTASWTWRPLPEPGLGKLAPQARQWELSRYRAYQARLAGRDVARTFTRCTRFLAQAADLARTSPLARRTRVPASSDRVLTDRALTGRTRRSDSYLSQQFSTSLAGLALLRLRRGWPRPGTLRRQEHQ